MMTEEKAEELVKEAESAEKAEVSAADDENSLTAAAEVEHSDESSSEISKILESDSNESTENSEKTDEKVSEKTEEKVVHAEKSADETKKAEKIPENFNGAFECALTTVDNPFDPLQNFDDWFRYDEEKGYHSCAYLARIAQINDEMSDEEVLQNIESAIDEIVKYDFMNIYKKVKRPAEE